MKLNPEIGQPVYVLDGLRYREMRVKRITYSTFVAEDLHGQEHRFWREGRNEIGARNHYATFEKPDNSRFEIDDMDKGKPW